MNAPSTAARPERGPDDLLRAYAGNGNGAGFKMFPLHHVINGLCTCGNRDCHSPGKHPRTGNGAHDATDNIHTLLGWAKRWPGCNWGMTLDGFVVIDVDPRNGGDAMLEIIEAKHGPLPDTCTQQTGGGGKHLLYRARDGVNYPGTLGPGVDVKRGAGSYICVEPSIHASGKPYLWIDGTDPHLVKPKLAPEWLGEQRKQPQADAGASITVTPEVLRDLESALSTFNPDDYSDWIHVAHALRAMQGQGFALWDKWARQSNKHDDGRRDPAQVWASVTPQWATHKSIFATAQKRGWVNPKAKAKREQADARAAEARAGDDRPLVQLVAGERHKALASIDAILAGTGRVFQRSGKVVHVSHRATKVHGINVPERVVHIADASAKWVANKVGTLARIEKLNNDGNWKVADVSDDLAGFYVALTEWELPALRGIAAVPVLHDGRIISEHGYNAETGLWVDWRGGALPVPREVSRHDALAALQRLAKLIDSFPYVDAKVDGTVALAALMAGAIRPSLPKCPAFAFQSPTPGTGKTTLAKVISQVAMGGSPLPLTFGHSEEEFQKAIATAVLLAAPATLIDNINSQDLNSATLAVVISEGGAAIRLFNTQQSVAVECPSLFLMTGNALWVADDLLRRVMMCDLDPGIEHPEFRDFDGIDPVQVAHDNRAHILTDVHTVIRGFMQSDATIDAPPIAGFNDFCRLVRDPLIWLGQADLADKMKAVKAANPKRISEAQLLDELHREFSDKWVTAAEIMQRIDPVKGSMTDPNPHLRAVIEELCGKLSSRSLGRLLQRATNRIIGGYVLRTHPLADKNGNRYRVEPAKANDAQRGFDV